MKAPLVLVCVALLIGGISCKAAPSQSSSAEPSSSSATSQPSPGRPSPSTATVGRQTRPTATPATVPAASLALSFASSHSIQQQPAADSCHESSATPYSLPDRLCTPGALNPAVTQATLGTTICKAGYSKTIRPTTSVTNPEKLASMRAYGDTDSPGDYEYDHLVSLELGGAPNDARNLWPEPGGSPNPKDRLENRLHSLVCNGQLPLSTAQQEIATNWTAAYHRDFGGSEPGTTDTSAPVRALSQDPTPSRSTAASTGGSCSASISDPHPGRGGYETVTVRTGPNATVQTVAHYKSKDTEHDGTANGGGIATITFSIGSPSAGYTVQVDVTTGTGQSCSTAFTPQ